MVVQCPYCESALEVEDASELVHCDHCRKEFNLRIKETVTCPGCGADLTVPPGATVVICGKCRRRVQVRMPEAQEPSSGSSNPLQDQSSSGTDETADFQGDTSIVSSPGDFEQARLQAVQAEFADRYEVLAAIGRGGMGAVYKAKQKQPERVVVLKVMLSGRFASEKYRIRFEREAQAIARLKHPGIVSVFEYGEVHGQPYFSMEYVDGCNVREYVARYELDKRAICALMMKITRAVAYAHRGIIHRDIKPANILVDGQGDPRLLDFGLARLADDPWVEDGDVTEAGEVMGTPSYMSPEQTMGRVEEIDLRSNVYSIGVLFYELLTNNLPYRIDRTRPLESLRIIREFVPKLPSVVNPTLDSDLDSIVMKCLEKERELRYQSAVELSEDINRYVLGKPVEARPSTVFYQLRKLVWRRRTLFLPISAAVLIGLALNVVFIVELIKNQRRTSEAYAQVVDSNQQIIQFVADLRAIRSTVDTMITQGRWEEAYDKALFAQRFFADRGYAGYADEVRKRVATEAQAELGKTGDLVKALKFKEAQDKIHQLKEVATHLQLGDLSTAADHASSQFAEDCWQSLSAYIEGGGGSAKALERFLAEVPGTEYDEQAKYILQKLMHSIRFTQWPFDAQEALHRQRMTSQVMELPEQQSIALDQGASLALTLIPAGEFLMGSASDQPGAGQDSVPQHRVRIGDPFYVSITEITCAQFEAVTGRLPSALTGTNQEGDASLPAPVSWQEAEDFCKKLSLRANMTVRLPTEAEWEYFCRAGSDGVYGSVSDAKDIDRFAWDSGNSDGHAHPVGKKDANVWGIHDLMGNLREWCRDWYDARYYLTSPVDDPTGPPSGNYRVLRGGSYADGPEALQVAMRAASSPDSVRPTYGFRVCVNVMDDALAGLSGKAVASSPGF